MDEMTFPGLFGSQRDRIRIARQESGLTQGEVARRAKIDQRELSLYENGLGELSSAEVRRVQKVLHKLIGQVGVAPGMGVSDVLAGRSPEEIAHRVAQREECRARKIRRLKFGMSLRELSLKCHVPRPKLTAFENGKRELSADEKTRWEAALAERENQERRKDPAFLEEMSRNLFEESHRILKENENLQRRIELLEQTCTAKDEIIRLKDGQLAAYEGQIKRLTDLLGIKTKEVLRRDEIESKAHEERER